MLIIVMAVSAALIIYSVVMMLLRESPKERISERLDALAADVELEYIHSAVLSEKRQAQKEKKKHTLTSRRLENNLAMAGVPMSAREYLTLWVTLTLGPALAGLAFSMERLTACGLCIIGFALPPMMVQRSRTKQQVLFNKQLGESLTIMSSCMRTGYSFQQAMNSIAKEMQPPISTEFSRVVREINYGASMEQALHNMAARVQNKDMDLLISAVITSTQVGGNLSDILDTIAETVSDRIRLREEVRVYTAQGRMSGLIIGLLPVVVLLCLMILNPTYLMDCAENPIGKMLLGLSAVLEITGFYVINRMVDIKY